MSGTHRTGSTGRVQSPRSESTRPDEWLDRIHAEDRAAFDESVEAHLAGQTDQVHCEIRLRHEDGANTTADDVNGIRAIYGANTPDAYNGSNNSIAAAANVNSLISTNTLTALVPNLDLTTPSSVEDFTFQAPAGTSGTMTVRVQSQGLSLLTPKVTVYAADMQTDLEAEP